MKLKDVSIKEVLEQQQKYSNDPYNTDWTYEVLGKKYGSEKLVYKKMEWLVGHGYLDYGVSIRSGWLTEKGKEFLKTIN